MKIKLILAASKTDPLRKNDPFMPLSLPLLASTAPNHDYTLLDMLWEDDPGYDEPVDLVGISVRFTAENSAYKMAEEFRRRGVTVILGGPQISSVPLRAIKFADAVAVGEGEELWPVIVKDFEANTLKQLYVCSPKPFLAEGYTIYQVNRYPELSRTPVALRQLMNHKYTFDTLFASRGCPIGCDFCSVPQIFGTTYRLRTIDHVVKEIDTFKNYYYLLDDSVFGKASTYDYYIELYTAICKLKKRRYWTGQGTLDAAATEKGREVIRRARDSGLLYAAVGMESINPLTLQKSGAIRKSGSANGDAAIDKMREAIRFIQSLGIVISGWFVVGYDDDSIHTYNQTFLFCKEMNLLPVIFPVKALPATPLEERLRREGKLDNTKFINYRNPVIDDNDVYSILGKIQKEGYSLKSIIKRTLFYASQFKKDRIHKTIFSLVLQSKLRGGVDIRKDEFFLEDGEELRG